MVAVSKTHISNLALSHVGSRHNIEDVDVEESVEAKECRLWIDYSRQQALASYDWNFARAREVLTLHADEIPTTDNQPMARVWGFRYKYPANCLAVRKIQHPNAPPADAVPFDIELAPDRKSKTILTDLETAVAVFTFDQLEISLYTPKFILAHSLALAVNICFTLTGKVKLKNQLKSDFFEVSASAAADAANESVKEPPRDADWIRSRTGVFNAGPIRDWQAFPNGSS